MAPLVRALSIRRATSGRGRGALYVFLPSENETLAIAEGDLVKLLFRSIPHGDDYDAERMWVEITACDGPHLRGILVNEPLDMPQLRYGAPIIAFRRTDVIDIQWAEGRTVPPPPSPARRGYWERCMVDDCVLEGRSPVDYLYREQPDLAEPDDTYPDSGWRIRGTDAAIADDEAAGRSPHYVALGAVLNRDDHWLALIDRPVESRFIRDPATGAFTELEDTASA